MFICYNLIIVCLFTFCRDTVWTFSCILCILYYLHCIWSVCDWHTFNKCNVLACLHCVTFWRLEGNVKHVKHVNVVNAGVLSIAETTGCTKTTTSRWKVARRSRGCPMMQRHCRPEANWWFCQSVSLLPSSTLTVTEDYGMVIFM